MLRERQLRVITQTITRSSTTFTTHITLGRTTTAPPDSTTTPPAFTTLTPGAPVPTPTVMSRVADNDDGDNGLSSGEIGAILACVVFLVTGVLVALHIALSRRRRARYRHQVWASTGSTSGESSQSPVRNSRTGPRGGPGGARWSRGWREVDQRNGRRISVREREEIGVMERGGAWVDGAGRAARGRRVPDVREIRVHPRVVPVFSHVTHVRMPPPTRVRRPVRSVSSDSGD
ncbi:uncharacterized protein DNG_07280 [Cephalotrichum gorgonifer]|uniref:Transmembrane protein n=1 Tax=Cephalotrichum gorgonifer TaxID=2041049 RepID=A0AAE8N1H0_9PEZI|nr:uncharacterized protein DNG_07280 [Cephalotrichum gorgonifer]